MILRKYVKCDVYDIENIARKEICYTSPSCFNDPIDTYFHNSSDDEYVDIKKILTSDILKKIRISCFFNYEEIHGNSFGNRLSPTELLMWTYYAASHKGICLEYDVRIEEFAHIEPTNGYDETKKFLHEVSYIPELATDYGQLFSNKSEYGHYEELMQTVYFAKDEAFINEKEVRSLIYDGTERPYVTKPFPFLKKIIFGYRCSKDTKYLIACLNKQIYGGNLKLLEVSNKFMEVSYVEK
ncbi:MAG: DUF2971 domain-containing protein [Treponema sp.]|nr:DUF2971 domain-containing protein [Treponema sp.]